MEKLYIIGRDTLPGQISVGEGQSESLVFIALPGVSANVPLRIDLNAEGARIELRGVFVCPGDEQLSFKIDVHHNAPDTVSQQLFNGIAGGTARTSFEGLVAVHEQLRGIKANQENHNILLSDTATVVTSPQLEIYSDDVECSHGATTGFLNLNEQFYMRSRGIPEAEAKVFQMLSFLAPVVSAISDETVKEEISAQIEAAVRKAAQQI